MRTNNLADFLERKLWVINQEKIAANQSRRLNEKIAACSCTINGEDFDMKKLKIRDNPFGDGRKPKYRAVGSLPEKGQPTHFSHTVDYSLFIEVYL